MNEILSMAGERAAVSNSIATLVLIVALLVLRAAVLRFVHAAEFPNSTLRRRWIVMVRNVSVLLFLFFLVVIWAAELRTFALSITAVAVALVLSTKELILCLSGAILRSSSRAFNVGDRIEINGLRGDVIDEAMLTTTLLEVGPAHYRTGRAIVLPNSMFLDKEVINESFTERFVFHTFEIPVPASDWKRAESDLEEIARDVCAKWKDEAREHFASFERRWGLRPPRVEPEVMVQVPKAEEVVLSVRLPTLLARKGATEQKIIRLFLERQGPSEPG